jgi:cell division protease FtsH
VLGPVGYPEGGSVFLGGGGPGMSSRPYAEATQAAIDGEVSKLLRGAEERAVSLLSTHRTELDGLVSLLLEKETVDGADVYRLAGTPDKSVSIFVPPVVMAPHPAGIASPDVPGAEAAVTSSEGSTSAR